VQVLEFPHQVGRPLEERGGAGLVTHLHQPAQHHVLKGSVRWHGGEEGLQTMGVAQTARASAAPAVDHQGLAAQLLVAAQWTYAFPKA